MAAYEALNANHIDDAETRFKALIASEPRNPKALAGMGYIRMQQGNSGAIGFLEQAKQCNPNDKGLISALDSAPSGSSWEKVSAPSTTTTSLPRKSVTARRSISAPIARSLEGLGGTLDKAQQPAAAVPFFQRAVASDPASAPGWRGLFIAEVQSGNAATALATDKRIPAAVHTQLMSDPLFSEVARCCLYRGR